METNPALGVMIFVLGGLAGAVFYLPFKKVRNWAWESYWMIYALVGLIVVPWVLALCTSPNVVSVLRQSPGKTLAYCFACGALWGLGGFTWGLMIRYLGVGLGLAIGCGLCSAAGTLVPPVIAGNLQQLYATASAQAALVGVAVSLLGIVLVGMAGMSKESELPEEEKKKAVAEYNFKKGILIAIFSGLMSSGMSFGLQGGPTVEALANPMLTAGQINKDNLKAFVDRLASGKDISLSQFLWGSFSSKAKDELQKYDGSLKQTPDAQRVLADELNQIMQAGSIYEPSRFAGITLSEEVRNIAGSVPTGSRSVRANRLLLEIAYPEQISLKTRQAAVIDLPITASAWKGMAILVVVLAGGFVINFLYCLYLNLKNKTLGDYREKDTPLVGNLFFAGLAGAIWCCQFICFKTGEPAMGQRAYIGWAVLMASMILFSTLLGILLGEWNGTSKRTRTRLALGLVLLIISSVVAGYSGYLKT